MKHTYFQNDYEDIKRIRKFANYLKKVLYSLYIPHTVSGCSTSPTRYFHLINMQYKDKIIRVSNHVSKDPFYKTANVFNVIIKQDVDEEWTIRELNKVKSWLEGGEDNETKNL